MSDFAGPVPSVTPDKFFIHATIIAHYHHLVKTSRFAPASRRCRFATIAQLRFALIAYHHLEGPRPQLVAVLLFQKIASTSKALIHVRTITNKIDGLKQLNSICFGKQIIDYNPQPRQVSLWLALRSWRSFSQNKIFNFFVPSLLDLGAYLCYTVSVPLTQ